MPTSHLLNVNYDLLSFLNVILLACAPATFGVKKYRFPLGVSLVGLISTVLVYISANLTKFFFGVVLILGCLGLVKLIPKIQKSNLLLLVKPGCIFLYAFTCSFILNYLYYPGFLYKVVGNEINVLFNSDVQHRSSISAEILRSQGWGRLISPFFWPSKFAPYHIGAEAVAAFTEVPFRPHNVVSYAFAQWVLVVCGLGYALFQGSQLFCSSQFGQNESGRFSLREISLVATFITLSSFFISMLGGFGAFYGMIGYSHQNAPAWWGGFFILTSLLCFWKKDYLWFFYFLWVSCCFKISLAPTALIITTFYFLKEHRINSFRYFTAALIPVCTLGFILLLSKIDVFQIPTKVSWRNPINILTIDTAEVRGWSFEAYRRLYDLFFTRLPKIDHTHFHAGISWLLEEIAKTSQGFFLILFQITLPVLVVLFLGLIGFKRNKDFDPSAQKANLVFLLACGVPTLLFQTINRYTQTVNPWLINVWMGVFLFAFCSALLITDIIQSLSHRWSQWSATVVIVMTLIQIRPDYVRAAWEKCNIVSQRKSTETGNVLLEDDPLYAAFFGKRIHREAGDFDGLITSSAKE